MYYNKCCSTFQAVKKKGEAYKFFCDKQPAWDQLSRATGYFVCEEVLWEFFFELQSDTFTHNAYGVNGIDKGLCARDHHIAFGKVYHGQKYFRLLSTYIGMFVLVNSMGECPAKQKGI